MLLHLKLRRFEAILDQRIRRYLNNTHIDLLDLGVLITASEESRSQIELAKLLEIHPNVMTRISGRLEQMKLIERKAGDDKRRLMVTPTPEGLSLVRRIKRNDAKALGKVLHPLSPEQIEQLDALVTRLIEGNLDARVLADIEGLGSQLPAPQNR
jgi:DNA-binding MarR family transcriptional regulator